MCCFLSNINNKLCLKLLTFDGWILMELKGVRVFLMINIIGKLPEWHVWNKYITSDDTIRL